MFLIASTNHEETNTLSTFQHPNPMDQAKAVCLTSSSMKTIFNQRIVEQALVSHPLPLETVAK
jgi:hypothetical protein